VTLPLIQALRQMDSDARRDVERFFAEPIASEEGIQQIIRLVKEHGGIEYARARANEFGEQATLALAELAAEEPVEVLREAVAYVIERRR
jgi:geranylgeranyl pyrophosphate synthase